MRVAQIFFALAVVFFVFYLLEPLNSLLSIADGENFLHPDSHETLCMCASIAFALTAIAFFTSLPKSRPGAGSKAAAVMFAVPSIILCLNFFLGFVLLNDYDEGLHFFYMFFPIIAAILLLIGSILIACSLRGYVALKVCNFMFSSAILASSLFGFFVWRVLQSEDTYMLEELFFLDEIEVIWGFLVIFNMVGYFLWFVALILNAVRCGREASAAKFSEQVTPQVAAAQGFAQPTSSAGFAAPAAPATPAVPTTQQRLDELQRQIDELQRLKAQQEAKNNPQSNE